MYGRRLGLYLKTNKSRRFSNIECSDGMRGEGTCACAFGVDEACAGISFSPVRRNKPPTLSSQKLFLEGTTDSEEDTDTEDQDGLLQRGREVCKGQWTCSVAHARASRVDRCGTTRSTTSGACTARAPWVLREGSDQTRPRFQVRTEEDGGMQADPRCQSARRNRTCS